MIVYVRLFVILAGLFGSATHKPTIASEHLDFFQRDFTGLTALNSYIQQHSLSNDDVLAECSALIASVVPILELANAEIHEMSVDIYLQLERSQGSDAKKTVNAKTEKYLKPLLEHATFAEKEALMRRASKAIMLCRGFYHSVT